VVTSDPFASFAALQKSRGIDAAVGIEDTDFIKSESLANLKVVEVMARRDLQSSGPEFTIDKGIGD
jgi:hypothetical protein